MNFKLIPDQEKSAFKISIRMRNNKHQSEAKMTNLRTHNHDFTTKGKPK